MAITLSYRAPDQQQALQIMKRLLERAVEDGVFTKEQVAEHQQMVESFIEHEGMGVSHEGMPYMEVAQIAGGLYSAIEFCRYDLPTRYRAQEKDFKQPEVAFSSKLEKLGNAVKDDMTLLRPGLIREMRPGGSKGR